MISLAVAILVAGRFTYDSTERMVQVEVNEKHREDVTVLFNTLMPPSVAYAIASFDYIGRWEVKPSQCSLRLMDGC